MIEYWTSKFKLIISFLTKNKMHTNSSVSLVLALLKVLANAYRKTFYQTQTVEIFEDWNKY